MTRMIQALIFAVAMSFGFFALAEERVEVLDYESLEVLGLEVDTEAKPNWHGGGYQSWCYVPRHIRAGHCQMTLQTPVFGNRIPHGGRVTYATHGGYYHGWSQLICRNGRLMIWRDNVRWCGIWRR